MVEALVRVGNFESVSNTTSFLVPCFLLPLCLFRLIVRTWEDSKSALQPHEHHARCVCVSESSDSTSELEGGEFEPQGGTVTES
jgi:hypothetical protein